MADSNHNRSASDSALDHAATTEHEQKRSASRQNYDPQQIRQHDDVGKDRLFEDRQQHDEAEKNSEKNRLARDVERHHHAVDDDVADSGSGPSAKRKN